VYFIFRKESTESKKASPLPAKKLGGERSVKFKLSHLYKAYISFSMYIKHLFFASHSEMHGDDHIHDVVSP
jgi:hypothetical protein